MRLIVFVTWPGCSSASNTMQWLLQWSEMFPKWLWILSKRNAKKKQWQMCHWVHGEPIKSLNLLYCIFFGHFFSTKLKHTNDYIFLSKYRYNVINHMHYMCLTGQFMITKWQIPFKINLSPDTHRHTQRAKPKNKKQKNKIIKFFAVAYAHNFNYGASKLHKTNCNFTNQTPQHSVGVWKYSQIY